MRGKFRTRRPRLAATPAPASNFFQFQSYPTTSGWTAVVFVDGPPSEEVTVTAICANSRAVTGAPPSS
jgi:hypothetical protein